ncbi:hypothetical protein [Achromobacter marplatensis]|uniref:hypothetical protein n=1 Tax=Achromobacter marplatensis TaxID=470868 RepID=UPI0039F6E275
MNPNLALHRTPLDAAAFSLTQFEWLVQHRQHEAAGRLLLVGLHRLDERFGMLSDGLSAEWKAHFLTRLAAACGTLFADPGFQITRDGFVQFLALQRWLAAIFAATPFRHADHVIACLTRSGPGQGNGLALEHAEFLKYCVLSFPDSELATPLDQLWSYDAKATAGLCLAQLGARQCVTPAAYARREVILEWLPGKLDVLPDLDGIPLAALYDTYMHCSYGTLASKHDIKRGINKLLRQSLVSSGIRDVCTRPPRRDKPLMLVVLEAFSTPHSMYRTHASTLRASRSQFQLHGVALDGVTDPSARAIFDRFTGFKPETAVASVAALARRLRPDVVYYPSIGMSPTAIALSNLRLAPLQIAAAGHPATTHSANIDAMLVEEDTLGDPDCFSERLVTLPKDCLVHAAPPGFRVVPECRPPRAQPASDPIQHVAICATSLKLNARFLATCQRISIRAVRPVQFHFFVGDCMGIAHAALERMVTAVLPGAKVHENLPYADYLARVSDCDLFLNPFPYGNTNSIVDTVSQGLPGVCLAGREVHELLDAALFRRLQLPESLIATDVDQYERAAIELIDEISIRQELSEAVRQRNGAAALFQGNPEQFAVIVRQLLP